MTAAVIMCCIARWKPNARERLQAAALDLFAERGYDQATAAEIAARADLTERTFFRHFADKREVLFANEATMQEALVAGVQGADTGSTSRPVWKRSRPSSNRAARSCAAARS